MRPAAATYYALFIGRGWREAPGDGTRMRKSSRSDTAILCLIKKSSSHMISVSMFINHIGHKSPRPIARSLLMEAFYEFKASVSDRFVLFEY